MIHAKRKHKKKTLPSPWYIPKPTKRANFLTNPSPPVILITWYWTRHLIGPQGAFGYSSVSREGSSLSVPSTSHVSPWSDITCRCRHRSLPPLSFCYSKTPCILTVILRLCCWFDAGCFAIIRSLLINIQHEVLHRSSSTYWSTGVCWCVQKCHHQDFESIFLRFTSKASILKQKVVSC